VDNREFLRSLVQEAGISGYEDRVADIVADELGRLAGDVRRDKLGNVIALKRGSGPEPRVKVMAAAHMDEIGLMVTKIEDRGFIRFTTVGGVDQRTLPGQEVVVHGEQPLVGIIGVKPPHLLSPEERQKAMKMEELFIDVGLNEEEARKVIRIGDLISVRRDLVELDGSFVAGKALDDRAGVTVLRQCLEDLNRLDHRADLYAVATVQEEVGLRGAIVSTYGISPDIGIAIDVCHGDMPGVSPEDTSEMGKGPALALGGNVHPKVRERLVAAAGELNINIQTEVAPGATGTDAWAMQVVRAGVPTAVVSIPQRYMHTSVETLSLADVKAAGRLLAYFVALVDEGIREELKWL